MVSTSSTEVPSSSETEADAQPSRLERYAPLIFGVLIALPTLISYYPPMSDLPMHEGVVGIMRHYGDPEYFPVNIYKLNVPHPNQLFHIASWLISFLVGSRWAVKIVIALTQISIFDSGARFADHLKRSRWGALLLAPLALGFTYYWGLVANLLGFAALLYALPYFDRLVEKPTRRNILGSCGMFIYLFFAHESCYTVGLGLVVLFSFLKPFDLRTTALRLIPVAFAFTFGVIHILWAFTLFTPGQVVAPTGWMKIIDKLEALPTVIFGSHGLEVHVLLMTIFVIGLGALWVARARHDAVDAISTKGLARVRDLGHRYRFELIALAYIAAYMTLPFNWKGITLLHERFLGPAISVLVICVAPTSGTPRLAKLACASLVPAILLTAWPQFLDCDRAYRDLDVVLAQIPKGKAVASVVLDHAGVWHFRIYSAGPGSARSVAEVGGRASLTLTISPISPIVVRPEYRRDEFDKRRFLGSHTLFPHQDLNSWEYVLAQSREIRGRLSMEVVLTQHDDAEIVAEKGEWVLLHSKHATIPMEAVPPDPDWSEPTMLEWVRMLPLDENGIPHPVPKDFVPPRFGKEPKRLGEQ